MVRERNTSGMGGVRVLDMKLSHCKLLPQNKNLKSREIKPSKDKICKLKIK